MTNAPRLAPVRVNTLSKTVNVDDRLRKGLWRFLRQIVANPARDCAVLILA